jgi:hypothetical protein
VHGRQERPSTPALKVPAGHTVQARSREARLALSVSAGEKVPASQKVGHAAPGSQYEPRGHNSGLADAGGQ